MVWQGGDINVDKRTYQMLRGYAGVPGARSHQTQVEMDEAVQSIPEGTDALTSIHLLSVAILGVFTIIISSLSVPL